MSSGPPLHDPLAVFAVFAPHLFEDLKGERFSIHVVRDRGNSITDHRGAIPPEQQSDRLGQCGRTVVRLLDNGEKGVRIPRGVEIATFWECLNVALKSAEASRV
jgi:uridine nucleosidase